jgi:hypothetical protein
VVKQAMLYSIKSTMQLLKFKYNEIQELAVTATIDSKITNFESGIKNKVCGLTYIKNKLKWKQLWLNCHNKESPLVPTFA